MDEAELERLRNTVLELEQRLATSEAVADYAAQTANLLAIHLLTSGSLPPPIREGLSHFAGALDVQVNDHGAARTMLDALRAIGGGDPQRMRGMPPDFSERG